MIPVTKPFLPPKQEYDTLLNGIWEREWLTNNGPLVRQFESTICNRFGLINALFTGNGTIALQIAMKALQLNGEVITTPFSYVATTTSIIWEGCKPVFVDISENDFNINPALIEDAISDKTCAILATHCFGNPCDIASIQKIAEKYGLAVIYDAAHCFGTSYQGKSVFTYGDISVTSFHATKLFHTVEGGGVFCRSKELHERCWYLRNFGHDGPERFNGIGINGKNSELHAAMGLTVWKYLDQIMTKRKEQWQQYRKELDGYELDFLQYREEEGFNYAYFPVVFASEEKTIFVKEKLEKSNVFPRRYFYPALNSLDYIGQKGTTPVSDQVSECVLCLPLYHELKKDEITNITTTIKSAL